MRRAGKLALSTQKCGQESGRLVATLSPFTLVTRTVRKGMIESATRAAAGRATPLSVAAGCPWSGRVMNVAIALATTSGGEAGACQAGPRANGRGYTLYL